MNGKLQVTEIIILLKNLKGANFFFIYEYDLNKSLFPVSNVADSFFVQNLVAILNLIQLFFFF